MLGDFLIESRCTRGHESSATFRNYPRTLVEDIARAMPDRCCHPTEAGEEDVCGERAVPVISVLSLRTPARPTPRRTTKPSMGAVRVEVLGETAAAADSSESSTIPPPAPEGQ